MDHSPAGQVLDKIFDRLKVIKVGKQRDMQCRPPRTAFKFNGRYWVGFGLYLECMARPSTIPMRVCLANQERASFNDLDAREGMLTLQSVESAMAQLEAFVRGDRLVRGETSMAASGSLAPPVPMASGIGQSQGIITQKTKCERDDGEWACPLFLMAWGGMRRESRPQVGRKQTSQIESLL